MRLAILVSGRGSNLEAVLGAVAEGRLDGIEPVLVISNRPGVRALEVARRHHVPSLVLRRADFDGGAAERDAAIGRALTAASAQVALLAGYDQVLQPTYFAAFAGRTINIHPSLLPKHGGRGMVGAAVHRSVLAARDTSSGVTVHEVSHELDVGPILAQTSVPVDPGDDEDSLATRVLAIEHQVLVATLGHLAEEGFGGTLSARIARGRRV